MTIRRLTIEDIEPAAALLLENASETPWTATGIFTYFLRDDTILLAAEEDGNLIGFAALLMAPPESDILDIAVDRGRRNAGIGTKLLQQLLEEGLKCGVRTAYLEVRTGNAPARHLYEKLGFREVGYRKHYYTDPVEDAVVMMRGN